VKLRLLNYFFFSILLLIIIFLLFSYGSLDLHNKDLKTKTIVLMNTPEYISRYKVGGYYKISSEDNSVYRLQPKLLKTIKNDTLLWGEFKSLKKGEQITITYYNSARKNTKKVYQRIVQLKYKENILINIQDVQRIDRVTYFIVIGFLSLLISVVLYQKFRDNRQLKSFS